MNWKIFIFGMFAMYFIGPYPAIALTFIYSVVVEVCEGVSK